MKRDAAVTPLSATALRARRLWVVAFSTLALWAQAQVPPPTATMAFPPFGTSLGGAGVRIYGSDLNGASAVVFGATPATILAIDPSFVTVEAPAGTAGATVNVVVTTPVGSTNPVPYTYASDDDLARDFSLTANPRGRWAYGTKPTLTGPLTAYDTYGLFQNQVDAWTLGGPYERYPMAWRNSSTSLHSYGNANTPAGKAMFHPGTDGSFSVARWTAPSGGIYQVQGCFEAYDQFSGDIEVYVLKDNATTLHSGALAAYGNTSCFSTYVGVYSGGTVDFAVGPATGGNDDSTGVAATIAKVAELNVVVTTADSGAGSLRAAIEYANSLCLPASPSPDREPKALTTISFNIAGAGPHVIAPLTPLPPVMCDFTVIDGYTQPGSSVNTRLDGTNDAAIKVVLKGSSCTECVGLDIRGGSSEVRGLAIVGFDKAIRADSSANVYIRGNHIGFNPTTNNFDSNVVGIYLERGLVSVGSDSGSAAIDAHYSNLITANVYGIYQFGGTTQIHRNQIGGTAGGGGGGGNSVAGIFYANLESTNAVHRNYIRHNGTGIAAPLPGNGFVWIKENSIHSNSALGIDLAFDGITANDAGDVDTGPNARLNFPVITSVAQGGGNTRVSATVDVGSAQDGRSVTFEFFHNSLAPSQPSGEKFVGSAAATVVSGVASITNFQLPTAGAWNNVTATATLDFGDFLIATSEISHPAVVALAPPAVAVSFNPTNLALGLNGTLRIVVSNPNPSSLGGIGYTPFTPAGVSITSSNIGTDCFGAGGDFSGGPSGISGLTLNAGGTCTVDYTISVAAAGTYTINIGNQSVTSNAGSSTNTAGPATLTVTFVPPGFSMGLATTAVAGADVPLVIGVSRSASGPNYGGFGATLMLPAGVQISSNPAAGSSCGASVVAPAGGNTITASGGSISAPVTGCLLAQVNLVFPAPGTYAITANPGDLTSSSPAAYSNTNPITRTITVSPAPAPGVSLTPSPRPFGNVVVGTSSTLNVTLTNTGTATLTLSSMGVSGSIAFTLPPPTCPGSLAPGASCPIPVTFSPTVTGPQTATLNVASNAPDSPHAVTLTGTGVTPGLNPSTSSLAFGDQTINTMSAAQPVTITNSGTSNLTISSVTVTGDFQFTGCATPIVLVPDGSCTLSVRFFPTVLGARAGTIAISSDAPGSPHTVSLSGNGTPAPMPAIALAPASASFSAQVGLSASQTFALSNTGNANLGISSIAIAAPPPAAQAAKAVSFTQSNNCPASLAPSAACSIVVTYTPTVPGSESAQLQVFSNAVPSPKTAALSGTATAGAAVGLSPASLAFPPQYVGTRSSVQTVTLTNAGTGPLNLALVASTGDFGYSGCGYPMTLAPGASCSFDITFRPLTEGAHTGSIAITSNAPGSPHTIALSGTGVSLLAPQINLSPSSLGFGTVRNGRSASLAMGLTNSGGAPLAFSSIGSSGAFFSLGHNCPSSLPMGGTCVITVTYAPTATGAHSGQVVIHSNAIPSPHIAALSGTGQDVPPPFLAVDTAVAFGPQVLGTTARRTLTLANTGGDPLRVTALQIVGAGAGTFNVAGACDVIAPETTCDLTLSFTPTALQPFSARLDIVSNHSGGVVQVQLSGTGVPTPRPELEISVGGLGFGSQAVSTSGEPRTFVVTSIGQVAARLLRFAAPPDYVVNSAQCPAVLAPRASCEVSVTFRPVATGPRVGRLSIESDAVNNPLSVSLTGVGCRFFSLGGSRNPTRLCAP